ncbi:MAG: acyl-CoA dehydratase activase [Syntrophales bacterium]|nr:acyl-CoA dehydratase activase [Syntrophales bacterium]
MRKCEMYVAGLDIGSTMTKVVIMEKESILASIVGPTGAEHRRLANRVMADALSRAKLSFDDIAYVVATGYGRVNVPFADWQITEISCHAKGISSIFPTARTVIDIGGQDCKGIKLSSGKACLDVGKVVDFVMNDKCAAGTGRFLEVIAEALQVPLEKMGELSLKAKGKVRISSTCTVFAEQEVVSYLAEGASTADIVAGLHDAIASRIHNMVERIGVERDVVVTGGGAKNIGLIRALEGKIGKSVLVPPEPLLTGALGAALLCRERAEKAREEGSLPRRERRLEEVHFFT